MPPDGPIPRGDGGPDRRPKWLDHTAYCYNTSGRDVIFSFGWLWDVYEAPEDQARAMLGSGETLHIVTPGAYGPGRTF